MSFSIKQFVTGIGLKPVSADPSNPTQGQLQYADGTVRAEGLWRYDGTAWQQVGSGAGSYDIFFQENLETNSASNFTTGQAASPDAVGTGTLGGTLANETSSQISGDRSLKYTMNATAASSNNDFIINDTDIALDAKQKGNFIGVSFYYTYTGADDDIRFFVLDQDDNEITQSDEYIKANTNPTRFSTSVFIPSSDTAIRYGFQVVTGNSSKVFIVDDIEFSTNPFVYKNLTDTESIVYNGATGVTSNKVQFASEVQNSGAVLVKHSTVSSCTRYTFLKACSFIATASLSYDGAVTEQTSTLNWYDSGDSEITRSICRNEYTASTMTLSGEASVGDYLYVSTSGGSLTNSTANTFCVTAQATTEHVVTPAKSGTPAHFVGKATWAKGGGSWTTMSDAWTDFGANGSATTPTVEGNVSVPNNQLPAITISNTKSGRYKIIVQGHFASGQTPDSTFRLSDGTNQIGLMAVEHSLQNSTHLIGELSHDGLSDLNIKIQARDHGHTGGDNASVNINTYDRNLEFLVYYYPDSEAASETTFLAAVPMNYTQTKVLGSDVTTLGAEVLAFNNLVIGNMYEFYAQVSIEEEASSGGAGVDVNHDGAVIARSFYDASSSTTSGGATYGIKVIFKATATTINMTLQNGGGARNVNGDGTREGTFAQLTELNYTKETTRFT